MERRPLVFFALFFCFGIAASSAIKVSFLFVYLCAVICLFLSYLSRKKGLSFTIFISLSIFFVGAGLLKSYLIIPARHISRYIAVEDTGEVRGFINSCPEFRNNKTSFICRIEEILFYGREYKVCGDILVYVNGRQDLHYGQVAVFYGSLREARKNYLFNRSASFIMHIEPETAVFDLEQKKGIWIKRFSLRLKDKIRSLLLRQASTVTASILAAMILGERESVPGFIYNSMVESGTVHILVVSGFNVGIVAFIISLFLKLIRIPRRMRYCITMPFLIIYCLMTGASNPVVRATVMAIFILVAWLLKREADICNSLALAAMFILSINPLQLFDIGFQLSFASVLSIVLLYPKIRSLLRIGTLRKAYQEFLLSGCLVSLSAWLGTAGFIAYYFKMFSPVTVLANILIVPLATLITLCGLSLVSIGAFCPPLAALIAANCELLTVLLVKINVFLVKIPWAVLHF